MKNRNFHVGWYFLLLSTTVTPLVARYICIFMAFFAFLMDFLESKTDE